MADGVLLEAAIAGVVVISNITFGIIVSGMKDGIKDLRDDFAVFSNNCRDRHDDIPTKDDMRRDLDKIEERVDCIFKKTFVKAT